MRTNIVIDDQLMADVMASGDFKTKKEAVEEGLRLLKRRKVYDGLLALRGKLNWDDSDEAWAKAAQAESIAPTKNQADAQMALSVQEPAATYAVLPKKSSKARPTVARTKLAQQSNTK